MEQEQLQHMEAQAGSDRPLLIMVVAEEVLAKRAMPTANVMVVME
jgi:hypothetical protein